VGKLHAQVHDQHADADPQQAGSPEPEDAEREDGDHHHRPGDTPRETTVGEPANDRTDQQLRGQVGEAQ